MKHCERAAGNRDEKLTFDGRFSYTTLNKKWINKRDSRKAVYKIEEWSKEVALVRVYSKEGRWINHRQD